MIICFACMQFSWVCQQPLAMAVCRSPACNLSRRWHAIHWVTGCWQSSWLVTLQPRTHDRKTESQTQLAASVTQKVACPGGPSYVGALSPVSPRLQSPATQSHTSNDHVRMSTDRSSTLEWTLEPILLQTHAASIHCHLHIIWRKIKLNLSQLIIIYCLFRSPQ